MWNHWWNICIIALPVLVLALSIILGIRHVDRETVRAAATLGMSRRSILRHVILPQARGRILAGLLLAAAIAAAEAVMMLHYGVM